MRAPHRGGGTPQEGRPGTAIVVTEIPYQVNKSRLLEKIADLVREKVIEGIADLRDESDRHGMRIVIELRRGEGAGGGAEQPLQAHTAADVVRDHRPGHRGRTAARSAAARPGGAVPRFPKGGGPAPHGARPGEGGGAYPHPGRAQGCARLPGRGHRPDSGLAESSGGAARPHRALFALRDPGPGHSRHAAPAPDRPRARKDHRGAGAAGRDHPRAAGHSRERGASAGHRHRRAPGSAAEVRRPAAHGDHRGRGRGLQHRGSDRRRGRRHHRQQHRVHQADGGDAVPESAPGRQGPDWHADPGRGLPDASVHRVDACLHSDLHGPRTRLPSQGPPDSRRRSGGARQGHRQPGGPRIPRRRSPRWKRSGNSPPIPASTSSPWEPGGAS